MKKKQLLSLLLAAMLLMLAFAGCGTEAPSESSSSPLPGASADASDDTLVMCYPSDIVTLNPHTYEGKMFAQDWLYEGLTAFADNKVIPSLAESWDISEDGKVYTFHLRKDVVYSDGTDFNADSAKKNFDAVLLHKDRHSWLESLNQISDVSVIDDHTLQIKLENSYYPFLQEMSLIRPVRFCADAAFPANGDTAEGISQPIGTGMWMLKEHKAGEYAVFERNEKYWGEKPNFKYMKVDVITDPTTAVSAFKTGEIDMIYDIDDLLTADAFNELKSAGFQTYISNPQASLALALNTKTGFTSDLKVRQALEFAIDKEAICKTVYDGLRVPADRLFSTDLPYCNTTLKTTYNYDPDKAAAMLDDAGWRLEGDSKYRSKDGKTLSLGFCYISTDSISKTLGEVMQSMYADIGVEIKLVGEERNSFYDRQKSGEFDIIVSETWGNQYDPHSMVASFREPSHADYRAQEGLPNKAYLDGLITKLLVETDKTRRQEMYAEIFDILQDNAVYIPVCGSNTLCVTSQDLTGVTFNTRSAIPTQSISRTA